MVNFTLDPILNAITAPEFVSPFEWGGVSTWMDDTGPVFSPPYFSYLAPREVNRWSYGSGLFMPFGSFWGGSPLSRWGDAWYGADKAIAGATLLGWGDAITQTDPFNFDWTWQYYLNGSSSALSNPQLASLDWWRSWMAGKNTGPQNTPPQGTQQA